MGHSLTSSLHSVIGIHWSCNVPSLEHVFDLCDRKVRRANWSGRMFASPLNSPNLSSVGKAWLSCLRKCPGTSNVTNDQREHLGWFHILTMSFCLLEDAIIKVSRACARIERSSSLDASLAIRLTMSWMFGMDVHLTPLLGCKRLKFLVESWTMSSKVAESACKKCLMAVVAEPMVERLTAPVVASLVKWSKILFKILLRSEFVARSST